MYSKRCLFSFGLVLSLGAAAWGLELTHEGALRHPTVSITPEDVQRARHRIAHDAEAKAWFEEIQKSLAAWDDKDPAWVKSVMPGKGACFAYGFTGCPICGSTWGKWGLARASFDKPGHVICNQGHVLPDAEHPDPGTGYHAGDKRVHYFVGSYNAWVVETLIFKLAVPAANVYLLTGDERAAAMAAAVLDELAVIYPSCDKGSWDYPSNPPSGRLNRPWYQVARVLVHFVEIYDRIHHWPGLDEPSAEPGLTRRQNIERNLLLNGAAYCYEQSVRQGGLHNGQADYLRGVLAVGVCLGIPEYITWAVDGPYGIRAMLANNVDRDGAYFETSPGYGLHTRSLYLTFAEPLINYRGSVFPNGLNLYDDPRFQSFYVLPQMSQNCQGHNLPYGDDPPAYQPTAPPYIEKTIWDCMYSEYLASRVTDPRLGRMYAALNARLRQLDPDADEDMSGMVAWRVFHGKPDRTVAQADPAALEGRLERLLEGSFFFGQKGLAVLRQGQGERNRQAALRYGPSLVHGHLDDLNVNYFAYGRELTYDLGYHLGSTHTQVGWARQTASHNVVVVDAKSQDGGIMGGSLHHFADWPELVLVEASSSAYAYVGVSMYRRLFALAGEYALDLFRAKGGKQHDLPMHAIGTDVAFEHIEFGEPAVGSLAGPEYSWGELQLNDGDMKGYPNKPYWNPPPGNGYGFLTRPAEARPTGEWAAAWKQDDGVVFRMLSLDHGGPVVTAVAPGLYPTHPKSRYVIRRRTGENLSSCFVAVWEAAAKGESPAVESIRRIDTGGELTADSGLALLVTLRSGVRDVWLIGVDERDSVTARLGDQSIRFTGSIARCRFDGDRLVSAALLDGQRLEAGPWRIALDSARATARVMVTPLDTPEIQIDATWPAGDVRGGEPVYIWNPRYSRNSAYTLAAGGIRGDVLRLEQVDTLLGQGIVHEVLDAHTMTTMIPHEYAKSANRKSPTGFFQGKLLQSEDGFVSTHVREVRFGQPMTIRVDSTQGLRPGDKFFYRDVQMGDTVTRHHYCVIRQTAAGQYTYDSNTSSRIDAPPGVEVTPE